MSNIPNEYLCPITQSLMKNPVSLTCGHTYDRDSIEQWFRTNEKSCPTCRMTMSNPTLTTNWTLKSLIDKFNNGIYGTDNVVITDNGEGVMSFEMNNSIFKNISATLNPDNSLIDLCITVNELEKRRPISIVCLIDVSGSMGVVVGNAEGGKAFTRLDLVKHVLNVIIASLTEADCLSLISFSDEPNVILELVNMNTSNKEKAKMCVSILEPEQSTYTGPGLKCAYNVISKSPKNNIKSIVLLTDGQDTDGEEILQKTFERIQRPDQVQLNTFGFSSDIYSNALSNLAVKGGGIFGFIPDQSMIGTIFINFLANTFRTFAQDVRLKISDKFEFVEEEESLIKTILQFGRSHHYMIRKRDSDISVGALNLKIGLSDDEMVDIDLNRIDNQRDFDILRARYKMLELLKNTNLPKIDLKTYLNCKEFKIREFMAEMSQSDQADPNNEQIKLSLDFWDSWGAHYIRSFYFAHKHQQSINFKSPSMAFYRDRKFDDLTDKLTDVFCTLPPPKASAQSYDSNMANVSMRNIMDRNNGCILASCNVKLSSGEWKQICDLKKGDILDGGSKVVCLIKSKYDGVLIKLNDLYITPYHPVFYQSKWQFPIEILADNLKEQGLINPFNSLIQNSKSLSVCNLVLDSDHVVNVEGIKCITLGHGYEQDVLRHKYYGTSKCIEDLSKLNGWNEGVVSLVNYKTKRDQNEDVCAIVEHEYEITI